MKYSELLELYFELEFGSYGTKMLKDLVNTAMDKGEWLDGFHLAVKNGELEIEEQDKLLSEINIAYSNVYSEKEILLSLIEEQFPGLPDYVDFRWIFDREGALFVTDGLKVAKFSALKFAWITNRVSWDGVRFSKVENNRLYAHWYDALDENSPWKPLILSASTGEIIEGTEIEF